MDSELAKLASCSTFSMNNNIDPCSFDVTVSALLIGLGAEKYMDIFKKRNIGQQTLMELTDDDLSKLGVDDAKIRAGLIKEVRNLPIYEEIMHTSKLNLNLDTIEIADILEDSSQHLYRLYLSMLANNITLRKRKDIPDTLLFLDKYASSITIETLHEMTNILNKMDSDLYTYIKCLTYERNKKKILVGTVGGAAIAVLTVLFVRSLKSLRLW